MVVESFPEIPLEPLGSGWTLEAVIGAGGMGTVYQAHNARGERAAVKLLHPNLVGHSGTLKRVLREAELLGKLKHPGICQLKEAGLYGDDRPFLVMELLAGHSLKERHQTAPFSPAELLDFAIQVLEALAYAHGKGVVHRDLKPSNLFLTHQGRVKILDFGVARSLLDGNASQSSVGELIGTPAFMAPEQAAGRHDAVCPQTDIWSLGATLFTLLSGEYVHSGRTEAERLGRAMTVAPRAVRSVLPECPEALAEVIDKALAFEVQDRFRSAVSMRCALKNVSVGEKPLFALDRRSGNESGETLVVGHGENAPSDVVSVASEASASGSRAAGTELCASRAPVALGDIQTASSSAPRVSVLVEGSRPPKTTLGPTMLVVRYADHAQCLVWIENVQIIISHEAPTDLFMRRIIKELDELAKLCRSGTGALLVVERGCAPPSEEQRAYIRAELARSSMVAAAQVVQSIGFQGAAMRSALSLVQLMSRPPYPMKIFGGVEQASMWLALEVVARTGRAPSGKAIAEAARFAQSLVLAKALFS